ncbi:MAG: DUF1801 domain-containing protein [Flammeovirgaceae bacterium]
MHSAAVDIYILDQPEDIRLTLQILREIILETVTEVKEQIKWGVPFYTQNGLLCYLNYEQKTKKVILGLIEGSSIHDKYKLFGSGTQHVKKIYFEHNASIPTAKVKYYLREAVKINQTKEKNFISIRKGH